MKTGMVAGALAVVLAIHPASRLPAQKPDTTKARPPTVAAPADSTEKHISPVGATLRSLLIPGWGQAYTGRHLEGAGFVAFEGVAIMMLVRAKQELDYMQVTGSDSNNVAGKHQQIQDWAVALGFNHLFAAAEAYVSAHLMDFPKELKIRAVPRGVGVSFPLP